MGDVKESMSFTLRGVGYNLSLESVISTMNGVKPDKITKYYVVIGGEHYPPKQVLSQALGIPKISFTTKDAYDILTRLGLIVNE
ncbi:hypothetical protein KAW53_07855 [Candidatus Bathyarchaeota archaeon]|nr:hypothetical protein [Candidatus Bathyarchaeota archaeon]